MKKDSLKTNFIFQALYQTIILVIPLVISPYLTRVLGAEKLGIYTYSNSIAFYFLLICNLGILMHGQRLIVSRRDDDVKLRKAFWSLFSLHTAVSFFSLILYVAYCFLFVKSNRSIYLIQIFYVVSALVDITWLFYGLENFKSIVFKNIFVKVIDLILIFVFVKTKDDLWVYTLIVSCSLFAGQAIMIPQAIRLVKPIKFSFVDIKEHVKPLLVLFVSVIASTLYTVFDKTLLGILSPTIDDVAFYEYSNRITQVPRSILAVVVTVMFPRACAYVESNDIDSLKKIIRLSTILVSLFGSAFMFGLMAISDKLSIVYYGNEFSVCGKIIRMMSPLIWIIYISEILRNEYLVPVGKDFIYVLGTIISALVNISLSSILIPYLGINGAIIGSVSAELFGWMYTLFVTRKIYSFFSLLRDSVPFLLLGLTMGTGIYFMDKNTPQSVLWLILEILAGGVYYLVLMIPIIYFFYRDIWKAFVQIISARFKRGKRDGKN